MYDVSVYTDVHLSKSVNTALKELLQRYHELQDCEDGVLVHSKEGVVVHTNFQTIFRLKPRNELQAALHQHVMTHAVKAEQIVPGAFDSCLRILLNPTTVDANVAGHQNILSHPLPTLSELRRLVTKYVPHNVNAMISGMIVDALDLAGFAGKIIVERSSSGANLEHVSGYSFPLRPAIPVGLGVHIEPRILCVDGIIESVAEAHSLFEQIAESKQVCLLFVRGMNDEVKHTIKVNHDRGLMKVIPFIVRFDFDGINTLVDLATVSGNDVVSSHRGDLISAIKLHDHKTVDRVDVSQKGVVIYNRGTRASVARHVSTLSAKRDDVNEHLADLLEQRIRTLISNTVFLRIPDDMNFVITSQAIDYALRAVRSAIDYGISYDDEIPVPSIVKPVSEHYARKCIQALIDLAAAITLEDQTVRAS